MPSVGWALVATQTTDYDDHDDDNENVNSGNPESGGSNLYSSGLQGCLGVQDTPPQAATSPQSHSSDVTISPSERPLGQPDRGEETAQVSQAEPKYPTLQLALPMY